MNDEFRGLKVKRVILVLSAIFLISVFTVIFFNNKQVTEIVHHSSGGAIPMPFKYPIEIKSDSYPLHANEEFTIQSQVKGWKGSSVSIYYLESNELNENELIYKHIIPQNKRLIGTAEIIRGQFKFKWKVPKNSIKKGDGTFYIGIQSDKGIVSGATVYTYPYNGFEISPRDASIGNIINYNITGLPEGCTLKVYLQQVKPSSTMISTLGIFEKTNGSIASSFKLSQSIGATKIEPGQYEIRVIMIPKDENKVPRWIVFSYFNVK